MNRTLTIILMLFIIAGCKSKKTRLMDNDIIDVNDFVEFFTDIKLPLLIDDSILIKKENDSSAIGNKIFAQFVPDSVLGDQFGHDPKLRIYPLGKVSIKKFETYLFVKVTGTSKKGAFVIAMTNDNKFIAGMPLVIPDKDPSTIEFASMDKKYTITQTIQKKKSDGDLNETKNVYILNSDARNFSMIMTDHGIPEQEREIINPIDTFPRKNKFSGDYIKDKRNYVSIRDGKKPADILFFIHFEKDNGECLGELKGTASIHGTKTAMFRAVGNPCVLEFTVNGSALSLKEQQACGSYRDIKCFFDGSFTKKKESKPKVVSKKKK